MSYLIVLCLVITKLIAPAMLANRLTYSYLHRWCKNSEEKNLYHPTSTSANTDVMATIPPLPSRFSFSPLCVTSRALLILVGGGYGNTSTPIGKAPQREERPRDKEEWGRSQFQRQQKRRDVLYLFLILCMYPLETEI